MVRDQANCCLIADIIQGMFNQIVASPMVADESLVFVLPENEKV